jgi:hypothetical protein
VTVPNVRDIDAADREVRSTLARGGNAAPAGREYVRHYFEYFVTK